MHKELVVLRRALREARDRQLWRGDPATVVPTVRVRYQPRERWLEPDQVGALLGQLSPSRALWAALGAFAGLRLSEIEGLRWEHVQLKTGVLRAPGTKTVGAWRVLPVHPTLKVLLSRADAGGPASSVVQRWPNVRRDLAAACVRAGIPVVTPNDLRRTFASWLVQRGVSLLVVARLLGHGSTRMVEKVYGQLDKGAFSRAMGALPRVIVQRLRRTPRKKGDK